MSIKNIVPLTEPEVVPQMVPQMIPQMMPQMRPMPVMHPMAMQRPPFGKFRPCLQIALCADKPILFIHIMNM